MCSRRQLLELRSGTDCLNLPFPVIILALIRLDTSQILMNTAMQLLAHVTNTESTSFVLIFALGFLSGALATWIVATRKTYRQP